MSRFSALTIPADTEMPMPSGLPMVSTGSPTCSASLSPHFSDRQRMTDIDLEHGEIEHRRDREQRRWARSPSLKMAVMSSAPSTTCLLVTMIPLGSMMKPEP